MKNKTAVIFDENKGSQNQLRTLLESFGMRVEVIDNLDSALGRIMVYHPHVVYVNLNNPKLDGFTFLEKFRELPMKGKPIVFSVVHVNDSNVLRSSAFGASDYVFCPFKRYEVLEKLKKHFEMAPFKKVDFSTTPLKVKGGVLARLSYVGETGMLFDAPIKLAQDVTVRLNSALLDELDLTEKILKTSRVPARFITAGRFMNELSTLGISEVEARKIRLLIRRWKA